MKLVSLLFQFRQWLKKRYSTFLLNERNAPPYLFFLLLLLSHPSIEPISASLDFLLIITSLLLLVVDCNLVFLTAPLAQGVLRNGVMFLFGLFSTNEKWKLLLLLFHTGFRLAAASELLEYYLPCSCAMMCLTIYERLSFSSRSNNVQYFTGFFLLSIYSVPKEINTILLIASPLLFGIAWKLINYRFRSIYSQSFNEIKNGRLLAFWLQNLAQNQHELAIKLRDHRTQCLTVSCYCRGKVQSEIGRYLKRQIYQWGLNQREIGCDELLVEEYFQNLIENGQLIHCLYFLNQMRNRSHLPQVSLRRAEARVNRILQQATFDKPYADEYTAALNYDHLQLHFVTEIHSLLDLKLTFWREIQREDPRAHFLATKGLSVALNLHQLDALYNQSVRAAQTRLSAYDVSVLYAMFLTSATNFREQAEVIIKRASRSQERDNALGNYGDTHALRTYVHAKSNSYAKDQELLGFEQQESEFSQNSDQNQQRPYQSSEGSKNSSGASYKLIVDMVSNGLLRLLNLHKVDLLGEQLNRIIPQGYKEVHNVRLQNMFGFDRPYREIAGSKVLHSELVLPMRATEDNLMYAMIYIKVLQDIEKGLTFVSVVKKKEEITGHALLDLGGYITERSQNFNEAVLLHPEFTKYLEAAKVSWEATQSIPEQKFSIMINSINYTVTLNSPLVVLFLDKFEQLKVQEPPLHVQVKHQIVIPKISKEKGLVAIADNCANQAQSSTISSKANTSAINVLLEFQRKGRVPVFTRIGLLFLAGMTICGIGLIFSGLFTGLGWDNSSKTLNPIYDVARMVQLQTYMLHALIDLRQLNELRSNSTYSLNQSDYIQQNLDLISNIQLTKSSLQIEIEHTLSNHSSLLEPLINQAFANRAKGSLQSPLYGIQVTYLQLILNYLVDLKGFGKRNPVQTLLERTFQQEIVSLQMRGGSEAIDEYMEKRWKISLGIWVTAALLILLAIVLLKLSLRLRLALHQRLYDMLISQEPQMIRAEIQALERVKEVMSKWKEEDFRNNVLQFSHQVILTGNHLPTPKTSKAKPIMQFLARNEGQNLLPKAMPTGGRRGSVMKERRRSRSASHTLFTSIALKVKQDLEESHNFGQKRGKELLWQGSQYDPSKTCFPIHILLYIFLVLTIIFITGLALTHQNSFISTVSRKKIILSSLYQHNQQALALIYALQKLRPNSIEFLILPPWGIIGQSSNELHQVVQKVTSISEMPDMNYLSLLVILNQQNSQSHRQNYLLLVGEYSNLFMSLCEGTNTSKQEISAKMLELQTLFRKLRLLALQRVQGELGLMRGQFKQTQENVLQILLWGAVYCLGSLLLGGFAVWRLKKNYVSEVCLVSLLSGSMLTGNKRVGTFIAALAKSGQ